MKLRHKNRARHVRRLQRRSELRGNEPTKRCTLYVIPVTNENGKHYALCFRNHAGFLRHIPGTFQVQKEAIAHGTARFGEKAIVPKSDQLARWSVATILKRAA